MDAELFDPAWVGVKHLELDAARMLDEFATRRDPSRNRKDEAAKRIDLFLLLFGSELEPEMLLEVRDRRARVGDKPKSRV